MKTGFIALMSRIAAISTTQLAFGAVLAFSLRPAHANLLANGNLDRTHAVEIVPGVFLPKPDHWVHEGYRALSGPYAGEMSSEPWAGPAPTPVTTDGLLNPPWPEGTGGPDGGVFFKAFSGNASDGAATGHLYQDVPATPGTQYILKGWAGAEANFLADAEFAIEFFNGGGTLISGATLDLVAAGLFIPNGEPFNYKQYTITATAPLDASFVRARVSMIDGMPNPAGGGQAFVVDDFELVPEPSAALGMLLPGAIALIRRRR